MKLLVLVLCAALTLLTSHSAESCPPDLDSALKAFRSGDAQAVDRSITQLRSVGPEGLTALLAQYDKQPAADLLPRIDAVAGQRDAVWSRLFWYTDLEQAKAAAQSQRKPILYLRLLGNLTDEYSCANSRFFRTVLYANTTVSGLLRDRFVLVWASERPVPVMTIDFGDGRVLKRSVTGNSIHYVLDSQGRVVDALPGLFDPVSFARILTAAADVAISGSDEARTQHIRRSREAIAAAWNVETDGTMTATLATLIRPAAQAARPPAAAKAAPLAISKSRLEEPLLRAMAPEPGAAAPVNAPDAGTWKRIGSAHLADAALDRHSVDFVKWQNPALADDDAALQRTLQQFQQLVAQDTAQNSFLLRPRILEWLAQGHEGTALEDLNRRVYGELFLTPRSDEWLGLKVDDVYSALVNDGWLVVGGC